MYNVYWFSVFDSCNTTCKIYDYTNVGLVHLIQELVNLVNF
jgi:hypothetical protein